MNKLSYSLGVLVAQNLKRQGIDEVNATDMAKGIEDVIANNPTQVSMEEANQLVGAHMSAKAASQYKEVLEAGMNFLAENKSREGVTTLESGLQYEVLNAGDGPKPKATDRVTTHYHGTLINGQVFDSSVQRGEPATFPVNGVIRGWYEALQLMNTGSKWRLFVPHNLAYGDQGAGEMITPFSTLIFEVELLSIN